MHGMNSGEGRGSAPRDLAATAALFEFYYSWRCTGTLAEFSWSLYRRRRRLLTASCFIVSHRSPGPDCFKLDSTFAAPSRNIRVVPAARRNFAPPILANIDFFETNLWKFREMNSREVIRWIRKLTGRKINILFAMKLEIGRNWVTCGDALFLWTHV